MMAAVLLLSACTYQANVAPTAAPAGEVMMDRRLSYPVSYYVSPELSSLTRDASEGFACSAHEFPVNAGPAIASSIRSVNETAFASIVPGGTLTEAAPGANRHIAYQLDSFNPRLHFEQGWWSGTAVANTELVIRVTAYDAQGNEILRTVVSGTGYGEADGGCDAGAEALQESTNQAIKRTMENYVSRVINAQQL